MFVVTVSFRIHPGQAAAFLKHMTAQAEASLTREEGCHHFDVCLSDDPQMIFLYELYSDRSAFDAHLKSAHYVEFDATVRGMVAEKQVQFYHLAPA